MSHRIVHVLTALLLTSACSVERSRDPFTASGELIAMSGGDAGAGAACFTCHGLEGRGDGGLTPRLAGLRAGYLHKQMEDYAAGLRSHPSMTTIAEALRSDERRAVANYYAAMAAPEAPMPETVTREAAPQAVWRLYHRGDPARGLEPCATCHGEAGEGAGLANPRLAGQPPAYLAEQLRQWRDGERRNDPTGVMLTISRRLTGSEVRSLSRYAARLGPASAGSGPAPAAYHPAHRPD